jgi:hypothetical protein
MYCVDLPENAICVELLLSTLPGEFSIKRMNIIALFSRYEVCSFSDDSCYNSSSGMHVHVVLQYNLDYPNPGPLAKEKFRTVQISKKLG